MKNNHLNYSGILSTKRLAGWTFVETLIVIGIILVLTAAVSLMGINQISKASIAAAKSQIEVYSLAVNTYYLDCKSFPTSSQGLAALYTNPGTKGWNGPYVNKSIQLDPWSNPYLYNVPGPNGLPFVISSFGADGEPGGENDNADISSAE